MLKKMKIDSSTKKLSEPKSPPRRFPGKPVFEKTSSRVTHLSPQVCGVEKTLHRLYKIPRFISEIYFVSVRDGQSFRPQSRGHNRPGGSPCLNYLQARSAAGQKRGDYHFRRRQFT